MDNIKFASFVCAALLISGGTAIARDRDAATIVLDDLEWTLETNGGYIPWPDAVDYCSELKLDGHDDWRLPSLAELEGLYDTEADASIREPFRTDACCLWSGESLTETPAADMDEIAGEPEMYHWGYMFDGAQRYYAVHIFDDGQALCVRDEN